MGSLVQVVLFVVVGFILVPDDTVYLSHSPPSFGTGCTLILDVIIASYYTSLFFNIFL